MKQTHEMTANPMLTDAFSWAEKIKFSSGYPKKIRRRFVGKLANLRKQLLSAGLVLLIGGVFLTGSYLFFIQLAKYGW